VQADGARLEIYGDFEAQRQPPRPSNTGYAVLATTSRIDFWQQRPNGESAPAAGQATWCPLSCLTHVPRGIGFADKPFRLILK
jgi:hypothetical protein